MYIVTPSQMRAAEENAAAMGLYSPELMERAGEALVKEILKRVPNISGGSVLIICGKGNNGGDGFTAARLLADRGVEVCCVLAMGEPSSPTAAEKLDMIRGRENIRLCSPNETEAIESFSAVIDAVFGTGFHGELPGEITELFEKVKGSNVCKIAADIPSGADSQSGFVSGGTIPCTATVTFGAVKTGMFLSPAKKYCGDIIIAEIGITEECFKKAGAVTELCDMNIARNAIPVRGESSHKGRFGKLLIIGGCDSMSGAAALNVLGAARSGAGIVRLASAPNVINRTAAHIYEATYITLKAREDGSILAENIPALKEAASDAAAVSIGSGLCVTEDTKKIVREMILFCGEKNIPIIIDADGLNCIADCIDIIRQAGARAILTPHPAELGRLIGRRTEEVTADRLCCALRLSDITGAVVCAKGFPTYIVSPGKQVRASYTGNGGLSRGGSGDVLTGVISGIVTSNEKSGGLLYESACAGVFIFGYAADIAADNLSVTGMLPSDAAAMLPRAFKILGR